MKYFAFFNNYYETLKDLPDDMAGRLIKAIMIYMFDGEEVELSAVEKAIFQGMKVSFDKSKKRSTAGQTKSNSNQTTIKSQSNDNQTKSNEDQTGIRSKEVKKERSKEVKEKYKKEKRYSDNDNLDAAIKSFIDHRKAIKKPMTDHAIDLFIKRLNELDKSVDGQIRLIETAIERGWQSVYPDKDGKGNLNGNGAPKGWGTYYDQNGFWE